MRLLRITAAFFALVTLALGCAPTEPPRVPETAPPPTEERPASATIPDAITLEERWTGLRQPVQLTHAGDGTGRLFVVEQGGLVRVIADGDVAERPFLDLTSLISTGGERGLLGIAFSPTYDSDGRLYVNYTDRDGHTVVARYRVIATDPSVADARSAQLIVRVEQPYANHNGGQIAFGPDGYLYIGMGDGGSGGDPLGHGQNPDSLLGAMLRIDVASEDAGYRVPPDNPFAGTAGHRPEIWATGLRNPWRFSFDRETGDLYIADVGQNAWEEVNVQPAESAGGENYGWSVYEGTHPFSSDSGAAGPFTMPVVEYGHDAGRSVTGGFVYRGAEFEALRGVYFYGDFVSGSIWALANDAGSWRTALVADTEYAISAFGQDEAGEVYVLDWDTGAILRIMP